MTAKGHNYEHGKGDVCKKCGKVHKNPFFGKKHSEKTRRTISKKNTGRKRSTQTKANITAGLKKYYETHDGPAKGVTKGPLSEEHKQKLRNAFAVRRELGLKDKPHSLAAADKTGASLRRKWKEDKEYREHMVEGRSGRSSKLWKDDTYRANQERSRHGASMHNRVIHFFAKLFSGVPVGAVDISHTDIIVLLWEEKQLLAIEVENRVFISEDEVHKRLTALKRTYNYAMIVTIRHRGEHLFFQVKTSWNSVYDIKTNEVRDSEFDNTIRKLENIVKEVVSLAPIKKQVVLC